jgi:acyl-CoA synthetase (AMP-forming)/AMP-acid ligase II/NAD(P)-dependent dehydrogenase (short-subunit alcohol dehydrogenase family)/acyl carrier protein
MSLSPPLAVEYTDRLKHQLLGLPQVREVFLLFPPTPGQSAVNTVQAVLACNALPSFEEAAEIAQKTLPKGWDFIVSAVAFLPLTPDGMVDEAVLAGLPGFNSKTRAMAENLVSGLDRVQACAAVYLTDPVPVSHIHLDLAVPGWRKGLWPESQPNGPQGGQAKKDVQIQAPLALVRGAELPDLDRVDMDVPRLLEHAVHDRPARFITLTPEGEETVMTTRDVWDLAGRLAGHLEVATRPLGVVILMTSDPLKAVAGFWGCLRGGRVAALLAPPRGGETQGSLDKLKNIWTLLGHPPVAVSSLRRAEVATRFGPSMEIIDLNLALADHDSIPPSLPAMGDPDIPALITFTSGSTGRPKGVPISFRNLRSMHHAMEMDQGLTQKDVSLNWLPMDHLGPINFFSLMPALRGSDQVHVPTERIMKSPLELLDLFHQWRCTNSWSPNFAFNMINACEKDLAQPKGNTPWDLSCVRLLINAGESVVEESMTRFCKNLAPFGLDPHAVQPAFGMTESTTGISFGRGLKMAEPDDPMVIGRFVDLGHPVPGTQMRIVDEKGAILSQGRVGMLQITGPQVTLGYLSNPKANAESFSHDGWFITGDLAFLKNNRLYITGRAKEVVIINGLNYNCHEIEAAAEGVPGVAANGTAAVAGRPDPSATEELTLFFNPSEMESGDDLPWCPEDGPHLAGMMQQIKKRLAETLSVTPARCLPVASTFIARTATGKVRRTELARQLASGCLDGLVRSVDLLEQNRNTLPPWFHETIWRPRQERHGMGKPIQVWLLIHAGQPLVKQLAGCLSSGSARVILAGNANRLRCLETDRYELPPGEPDGCDLLLDMMEKQGIFPQCIVDARHLGPVTQTPDAACLLPLASALTRRARRGYQVPDLWVLADHAVAVRAGDRVDPNRAMLPALTASVSRETGARCSFMDLDLQEITADCLANELGMGSFEPEIAWRKDGRMVQRFQPLVFPRAQAQHQDHPPMPGICQGQPCIVTGGLGGVGEQICRRLIERFQARIIVLGRNNPVADPQADPARQRVFSQLSHLALKHGGQVCCQTADLNDPASLEQALSALPSNFENARVFHLAGQERITGLERETLSGLSAQWRIKAGAAQTLMDWTTAAKGRSLCAFSSLNALLPTMGTAAYAAANRAMEEMITASTAQGIPAQCLSWSSWAKTGMSRHLSNPRALASQGFYVLDPLKALFSLEALLPYAGRFFVGLDPAAPPVASRMETSPPPAMIRLGIYCESQALPSRIKASLKKTNQPHDNIINAHLIVVDRLPRDHQGQVDREILAQWAQGRFGENVQPGTQLEKLLAHRMGKILGVTGISVDENFFALGGDSLGAARFLSRIKELLGVEVSLQKFFNDPTIAGLVKTIQESQPESTRLETMARLRLEVEALSPEQILARLKTIKTNSQTKESPDHE